LKGTFEFKTVFLGHTDTGENGAVGETTADGEVGEEVFTKVVVDGSFELVKVVLTITGLRAEAR